MKGVDCCSLFMNDIVLCCPCYWPPHAIVLQFMAIWLYAWVWRHVVILQPSDRFAYFNFVSYFFTEELQVVYIFSTTKYHLWAVLEFVQNKGYYFAVSLVHRYSQTTDMKVRRRRCMMRLVFHAALSVIPETAIRGASFTYRYKLHQHRD